MMETRPPELAKRILTYFVRNPEAADTVEGIARWRLLEEAIHQTTEDTAEAIDWLESRDYLQRVPPIGSASLFTLRRTRLKEREGAGGVAPLFRLNPTRVADAERFLADVSNRPPLADTPALSTAPGSQERVGIQSTPSPLMSQSLVWINATLLRYHRQNPAGGNDMPGLTRSHSSIESALLPGGLTARPGADEAQRNVDEAALDLTATFEHADQTEPLAALYRNLGLTPLELQALLLCLAPELDAKYQSVYGVLNDDLSRRTVTLGLLCRLLCRLPGEPLAIRDELARSGGLMKWRLLEHGATLPYADEPLRLDAAVVAWLLGSEHQLLADPRLSHLVRSHAWPGANWMRQPADISLIQRLAGLLSRNANDRDWIALSGEDVDGWRALVEAAAREATLPLVRLSLSALAGTDSIEVNELAARVTRGVRLLRAVPILDVGSTTESTGRDGVTRLVAALTDAGRPGVLIVPDLELVVGALPRERCELLHRALPDGGTLSAAYSAAAADVGLYLSTEDAERLALAFPLPLGSIDEAVRLAILQGAALGPLSEHFSVLSAACRRIASPDLPRFARRVEPVFGLDDVVLPADRRAQLDEIVAHVRYAAQVLHTWGFSAQLPYGRGVAALFCGPSGTGKTMAAQAIARALDTDTYVVDLSRIVSKFIGESEKNIDVAFRDAQRAGAVLQIDEAEAMFGKRSEIKDAHDRYANLEVSYLLQRMEAFDGVAILTTNFRQNLDQAFLRRLRFVVEFPKPDAEAREAIWRRCLPKTAPFREDINVRFLARRLELTGGNIRQITVRAAFAAASERAETIAMRHIVSAARAELLKLGMPAMERELADFDAAQQRAAARVA